MNSLGMTLPNLVYSHQMGPRMIVGPVPVAASQAFKFNSGRFMIYDGSDNLDIAGSGDTQLVGWAVAGTFTSNTVAAVSEVDLDVSPLSCYWIPADGAITKAVRGDTCDLIVASNIQKADIGESSEDVIVIADIDIKNQLVLVHMNPNKMYTQGVA